MKITKITRTKKNNNRCNVFIDGIYNFTCQCRFLQENGIFTETEINEEAFEELKRKLFFNKSLEYLISILASRDYTEKQIMDKLRKRDIPDHISDELLDYLKERDYINERRYLKDYMIFLNSTMKYSNLEKRKKVFSKQFSGEAMEMLDIYLTEESERNAVQALIDKMKTRKTAEQIMHYLSRKGFPYSIVREEIKNVKKEE